MYFLFNYLATPLFYNIIYILRQLISKNFSNALLGLDLVIVFIKLF